MRNGRITAGRRERGQTEAGRRTPLLNLDPLNEENMDRLREGVDGKKLNWARGQIADLISSRQGPE
jgi:hypothetical protein